MPVWATCLLALVANLPYCYYHNKSRRSVKRAAIGLLCDSDLVDQLLHSAWPHKLIKNNNINRCCWVNVMLRHVWRALNDFGCAKIRAGVAEAIKHNKPTFIASIDLHKLDLGTMPPHIISIKVLNSEDHKGVLELEVEFDWMSNLETVIQIVLDKMYAGAEIVIDVKNFQVFLSTSFTLSLCDDGLSLSQYSGKAFIRLFPFVPGIPPFEILKWTYFEKPKVDFDVRFGGANLNEDDESHGLESVGQMIRNHLKTQVEQMGLYPRWLQMRIGRGPSPPSPLAPAPPAPAGVDGEDGVPSLVLQEPTPQPQPQPPPMKLSTIDDPEGILHVRILRCKHLVIGDINTSDPYVRASIRFKDCMSAGNIYPNTVIYSEDDEFETEVIAESLNPEWKDAVWSFILHDRMQQVLHLEVWDKDLGRQGETWPSLLAAVVVCIWRHFNMWSMLCVPFLAIKLFRHVLGTS